MSKDSERLAKEHFTKGELRSVFSLHECKWLATDKYIPKKEDIESLASISRNFFNNMRQLDLEVTPTLRSLGDINPPEARIGYLKNILNSMIYEEVAKTEEYKTTHGEDTSHAKDFLRDTFSISSVPMPKQSPSASIHKHPRSSASSTSLNDLYKSDSADFNDPDESDLNKYDEEALSYMDKIEARGGRGSGSVFSNHSSHKSRVHTPSSSHVSRTTSNNKALG